MSEPTPQPPPDSRPAPGRDLLAPAIAIVVLLFFGWLTMAMLGRTVEQNETTWTRSLYLYHGIESIAFAAAGFLFGREVQRRRVNEAEDRAAEAARAAGDATARGNALADSVRAESARAEPLGAALESTAAAAKPDLARLAALADSLFPPAGPR